MKFLGLVLILSGFCGTVNGQSNDNPCGMYWGPIEGTPIGGGNGGVFYYVQHSTCTKTGGICGNPKIGIEHTYSFPVRITIRLKGIDCDGQEAEMEFSGSEKVGANQKYVGQGNWHYFKRVDEVVKVTVDWDKDGDHYENVYDKAKDIKELYINGLTREQIAEKKRMKETEERKEAEEKKKQEQEQNKRDEEKKKRDEASAKKKKEDDEKERKEADKRKKSGNNNSSQTNPTPQKSQHDVYTERKALDDQYRAARTNEILAFWNGNWAPMSYLDPAFGLQMSAGFSASEMPLITNSVAGSNTYSSADNFFGTGFYTGLELWPYRNNNFGIGLQGKWEYDWGLLEGYEGYNNIGEIGGKFLAGLDHIKLVGEYAFGYRTASSSLTVTDDYSGTTATSIGNTFYSYSRFGLGLMGDFSNDDGEQSVTLMLFRDKLDFSPDVCYAARLYFRWYIDFFVEYGQNYAVGGTALYPLKSGLQNQDFLTIGIVKNANIFARQY